MNFGIKAWGAFLPLTLVTLLLTGCVAPTQGEVSDISLALGDEAAGAYEACMREVGDWAYCASFLCNGRELRGSATECWAVFDGVAEESLIREEPGLTPFWGPDQAAEPQPPAAASSW